MSAEVYSGNCGVSSADNVVWSLDTETGILTISGVGEMENFSAFSYSPWYSYRSYVRTVSVAEGVTSIADYAFYRCTNLADIKLPDSVTSIGKQAFYYCESLESIKLPDYVKYIHSETFSNCTSL